MMLTKNSTSRPDWNGGGVVMLIDKPPGWTSFDVVKKVRSLFQIERIGHAGTLDPAATGLLIVCTGPKTRTISRFMGLDKEYTGTLELGMTTASFDLETPVETRCGIDGITDEAVRLAFGRYTGQLRQAPPMYSAAKQAGKPLYKLARRGKTVARTEREIIVHRFDLLSFDPPRAGFLVRCSKGTYIRSLVHDVGRDLGCGAVLTSLRRTLIGPYDVRDAWTIEELIALKGRLAA